MPRHTYKQPKNKVPPFLVPAIGVGVAMFVFLLIPLSQKLGDIFQPDSGDTLDDFLDAEPPVEEMVEEEQPPEEQEEEEPPEMAEESQEMDTNLDMPSLDLGLGGGIVLNLPKFNVKDDPNALFDSGDLDQPPRAVTKFPPQYPPSMRRKGITGRVIVAVQLSPSGAISQTSIKTSSGHTALDRAAEQAIRKWRFKPGMKRGKPVRSKVNIPMNFKLNR